MKLIVVTSLVILTLVLCQCSDGDQAIETTTAEVSSNAISIQASVEKQAANTSISSPLSEAINEPLEKARAVEDLVNDAANRQRQQLGHD